MVSSSAGTVAQYLAEVDPSRRATLRRVRTMMKRSVPRGIVETMNWGMIAYEVPLSVVPDTYNGKPLMFAALAAQKQYISIYLTGIYGDEGLCARFEQSCLDAGFRLDLGKSCLRMKREEDIPFAQVADALSACSMETFVERYQALHPPKRGRRTTRRYGVTD